MKIKRLNIDRLKQIDDDLVDLCFIKLPNSKLYRVITIPEEHIDNAEFIKLLHALSKRFHPVTGIFFFYFEDDERHDVIRTLLDMGIQSYFVEPELDPTLN